MAKSADLKSVSDSSEAPLQISFCADDMVMIDFGSHPRANQAVRVLWSKLMTERPDFLIEPVAGVSTLAVVIADTADWEHSKAKYLALLRRWATQSLDQQAPIGKEVALAVCYHPSMAPDLDRVAQCTGLDTSEVIRLHQESTYSAELIGFMPGFAYLSGLDKRLNVPRLPNPRSAVPPGALGITGDQCAVYPSSTPGGWNLIGRCPELLFDPKREPSCLIELGDRVRFISISKAEFERRCAKR